MSDSILPCVEIEPEGPAKYAVIWLHGLGADGNDFVPLVPYLGIGAADGVRFVFPHAPRIPVTINMGMVMPAWYDIVGLDAASKQDAEGIHRSAATLRALIGREKERGIPAENIFLAGFSQGGAIATHVALRYPEALRGLMALSTYLVLEESLEEEIHPANRSMPIFQAHGTFDPMVVFERGTSLRARLEGLGYDIEWHEYPMQHEVCQEEVGAIREWLARRMAESRAG